MFQMFLTGVYSHMKQNIQDHNSFPNILRLFDVLPNFPFTTSQATYDYYL